MSAEPTLLDISRPRLGLSERARGPRREHARRRGRGRRLLGANGAGKTTTLLTISGLLKSLEGSVDVFGEPTTFGAPHKVARRGLAHVAEDRSLFFSLTVQENLGSGSGETQGEQQRATTERSTCCRR